MAERYGLAGRKVLCSREKGNLIECVRNPELERNIIGDYGYYTLSFYMGDFQKVKTASKNPQGSLGWSESFIRYGIRLILLYLYDNPLPSKVGQYRRHYGEVAQLLALVAEIKASMGEKQMIFWEYKKKFPRHSSFQSEMRSYFGI